MQKSHGFTRGAISSFTAVLLLSMMGCAGISGHQVVQNRVVVAGGAVANVHVDCPSGKKVLGGGFNIETPDDIKIFASDPSDGKGNLINNGWNVMVRNAGTQDRQVTAVGVCADAR